MSNQELTSTTTTVATLSKKGQAMMSNTSAYILELESEIENLKRKNKEEVACLKSNHSDEIENLKRNHKEEVSELKSEIKTLKADKAELERLANSKQLQKEYIKDVETQLDRMPCNKNRQAKVKAIKFYVDMLLYYSNIIDSYNLRKSAAYGFGDKIDLINSLFVYAEHHPLSDNLAVIEKKKEKGIETLDSITTTVSVALDKAFR